MAKKSFKDNPALSFISPPPDEAPTYKDIPARAEMDTSTQKTTDVYTYTDKYTDTHIAPSKELTGAFVQDTLHEGKSRPAAETTPQAVAASARPGYSESKIIPPAKTPSEIFANVATRESKSKRLQLLIRPSTHMRIAELAKAHQTSINDTINLILEDYLRRQA